jgi:hypothetical protein
MRMRIRVWIGGEVVYDGSLWRLVERHFSQSMLKHQPVERIEFSTRYMHREDWWPVRKEDEDEERRSQGG